MNNSELILILQSVSFTSTIMMTMLLVFARFHTETQNRNYELSRWLLVAATSLTAIHYLLQIHFGFRAKGDDVGALFNILFYSPAIYLVSFVTLNMMGIRKMKVYLTTGATSFLAIITCFLVGWLKYRSLHMPVALYIMSGIFLATVLFFCIYPIREIKKRRRKIEEETAGDIRNYYIYLNTGTFLLCYMTILVPAIIFSSKLLLFIGPLFLTSLFFYVTSFVALGFSLGKFKEIIDEESSSSNTPINKYADATKKEQKLTPEEIRIIELALEKFINEHGYRNPELNASIVARRIGVSKQGFIQYLLESKGVTFRVWLSNLRIDQAKRMLLETNYSNETIATECGFSSRSWMQQKFKATTGISPTEWKDSHL